MRSDSEQDLSEDIMVLSENAVCEKMEATTPNLQDSEKEKSLPSFRVAQENRHQEIWSVLEGIWNTMNLYRYGMRKRFGTLHNFQTNTLYKLLLFSYFRKEAISN